MSEMIHRTVILTGYMDDGLECPTCEGLGVLPDTIHMCEECAGKGFVDNPNSFIKRVDRFRQQLPENFKNRLTWAFATNVNACIQYFFLTSGSGRGWDISIEHEWYCHLLLEEFPVEAVLVTHGEGPLQADMRHTVTSTQKRST